MRVIETRYAQTLPPRFALNLYQFSRRNLIPVVRRIGSRITGLYRCFNAPALCCIVPQQSAAALVRISLFAV